MEFVARTSPGAAPFARKDDPRFLSQILKCLNLQLILISRAAD
jgi:hypothetical protein